MSFANIARRAKPRAHGAAYLIAALCVVAAWAHGAQPASAQSANGSIIVVPPDTSDSTVPPDPECLTISRSSETTYLISNTACADQIILTSIELETGDAIARCFTKKIRSQISIASELAPPVINYQCIEGTPGCSTDILRGMFPECRTG